FHFHISDSQGILDLLLADQKSHQCTGANLDPGPSPTELHPLLPPKVLLFQWQPSSSPAPNHISDNFHGGFQSFRQYNTLRISFAHRVRQNLVAEKILKPKKTVIYYF